MTGHLHKARIVAESYEPGATVSEVARRHASKRSSEGTFQAVS